MAINLVSPAVFTTGILVGNTLNTPRGSVDSLPEMTKVDGQTVSAALEVQSTSGALLVSRMTQTQRDALVAENGMIVYNTDTSRFNMLQGDGWKAIGDGGGDVDGPGVSVVGNIAIFDNITGDLLADSGINVIETPALLTYNLPSPDVDVIQMSGLSHLGFLNNGLLYVYDEDEGISVVSLFKNTGQPLDASVVISTLLSPTPTTTSALLELQSTDGALLISRMSTVQMNALSAANGMLVYNTTDNQIYARMGGNWRALGIGSDSAPSNATYILRTTDSDLPSAQSLGSLTTGLLKNSVAVSTGTLSTAIAGVDYYAPGFPTMIIDTSTSETSNLYIGTNAGNTEAAPESNTGIGIGALNSVTLSYECVAIGAGAATNLVSGALDIAIGSVALQDATSASDCIAIGRASQQLSNGDQNVSIGNNTLNQNDTGEGSVVIGHDAGALRTDYTDCIFIGRAADATTNGLINATAIGAEATVSANNAVRIGNECYVGINHPTPAYALDVNNVNDQCAIRLANSTDEPNAPGSNEGILYVQDSTLYFKNADDVTTLGSPSNGNTILGTNALPVTGGTSNNVALGLNAASNQSGYENCVLIGANADCTSDNADNAIAIGYNATVSANNALVLGSGCNVGISVSAPAYPLDVGPISGLCAIRLANTTGTPPTPGAATGLLYLSGGSLYFMNAAGASTLIAS